MGNNAVPFRKNGIAANKALQENDSSFSTFGGINWLQKGSGYVITINYAKKRIVLKYYYKTALDEMKTSGAVFVSGDKTYLIFLSAAVKNLSGSATILLRKRLLREVFP